MFCILEVQVRKKSAETFDFSTLIIVPNFENNLSLGFIHMVNEMRKSELDEMLPPQIKF